MFRLLSFIRGELDILSQPLVDMDNACCCRKDSCDDTSWPYNNTQQQILNDTKLPRSIRILAAKGLAQCQQEELKQYIDQTSDAHLETMKHSMMRHKNRSHSSSTQQRYKIRNKTRRTHSMPRKNLDWNESLTLEDNSLCTFEPMSYPTRTMENMSTPPFASRITNPKSNRHSPDSVCIADWDFE